MLTPESLKHERLLDRRAALGAIGALGALVLGFPGLAAAANRVPVWRLDPVHRQGPGPYTAGCAACNACRMHARNKVFATKAAAAGGKAHEGCTCTVVRTSLPHAQFVSLFGPVDKPERTVIDRRWPTTRRAMKPRTARHIKRKGS